MLSRLVLMQHLDGLAGAGAATLAQWLLPRLETATVAGLRTSFLTMAGTEAVVPALRQVLERGGRVYVVAGGHPEQADPAALRMLAA